MKRMWLALLRILMLTACANSFAINDNYITKEELNGQLLENDDTYISPNNIYTAESDSLVFEIFDKFDISSFDIPSCLINHPISPNCLPSICKVNTNFGEIYVKIKGLDENGICQYIERTPGIGGINCSFPQSDLLNLQELFSKRFEHLAIGSNIVLNSIDVESLGKVFTTKCSLVDDYASTGLINIDKAEHNLFDPEFTLENLAKYSNNILSKHVENVLDIPPYVADLENYHSIMFSQNDTDLMNLLLESFNSHQSNKGTTSIFSKNSLGSFYINSILYINPNKWSVWVNNKRYTNDSPTNYISFDEVSAKRAKMKWYAGNLDRISPSWRSKLTLINGTKFISKQHDIIVSGKSDDLVVSFALKPNQTFDVTDMQIFEGPIN